MLIRFSASLVAAPLAPSGTVTPATPDVLPAAPRTSDAPATRDTPPAVPAASGAAPPLSGRSSSGPADPAPPAAAPEFAPAPEARPSDPSSPATPAKPAAAEPGSEEWAVGPQVPLLVAENANHALRGWLDTVASSDETKGFTLVYFGRERQDATARAGGMRSGSSCHRSPVAFPEFGPTDSQRNTLRALLGKVPARPHPPVRLKAGRGAQPWPLGGDDRSKLVETFADRSGAMNGDSVAPRS